MLLSELQGSVTENEGEKLKQLATLSTHDIVEIGSYYGKSTCYIASGAPANIKVYAIDLWNLREITSNITIVKKKTKVKSAFDDSVLVEFKFQNDGSGNIAQRMLPETWNIFQQQICATGNEHKVIPIKANSNEVAKLWSKPLSLLFIDGDHSYEQCLADYNNFAPFVIQNGYMAIHDYDTIHGYEVKQVVDEVIKKDNKWTKWEITDSLLTVRRL